MKTKVIYSYSSLFTSQTKSWLRNDLVLLVPANLLTVLFIRYTGSHCFLIIVLFEDKSSAAVSTSVHSWLVLQNTNTLVHSIEQ